MALRHKGPPNNQLYIAGPTEIRLHSTRAGLKSHSLEAGLSPEHMMAARASGGQHKLSSMPRNAEATASHDSPDSSSDADLSCLEEGGWEKDSPASTVMPTLRVDTRTGAPACSPERLPLRRSRPGQSSLCSSSLREENIDVLQKMLRAEGKFQPRVDPSKGGRALCYSTSPFVAERRRWFVAWEVRDPSHYLIFSSGSSSDDRPECNMHL